MRTLLNTTASQCSDLVAARPRVNPLANSWRPAQAGISGTTMHLAMFDTTVVHMGTECFATKPYAQRPKEPLR